MGVSLTPQHAFTMCAMATLLYRGIQPVCPKVCVGPFTQLDGGDQGGSGRRVL